LLSDVLFELEELVESDFGLVSSEPDSFASRERLRVP
jgi:hypothetical protein